MVTSNDINFVNSDLNNLIDEVVSSNPQLNNKIQKVKEESNLFICEILKFYTVKDKVQVRILSSNQVVTAHCTHDILSKDVSLKSMVKGVVNSDKNGATYIVPHSTIYGILAKVRYSGVTDEYCLISCVNFEDDFDLKSNVDSGEIRLTVGNSRLSVNDERINIMCPELFINGLPFSAPEFDNYHTVDDVNEIYNTLDESIKSVIVFGYYKDNNFYTTESYDEVIEKNNTKLFIDLATDTLYCVINDNYVSVGGGSSSNDYDVLVNKPCIDGVELTKESSSTNLGLATKNEVSGKADKSDTYTKTETDSAINNHHDNTKVDKVTGKQLSTNDYSNSEKSKLASLENYDDTEVKSDIQDLESNKADKSDTYTKTETDSALNSKVDKITGKQLSTNDYSNSEKSKLASQNNSWFGTCSTASATASKVVTIDDSNFELRTGTVIGVKFSKSNTASNVTLNVNGTGAKQIWYNNAVYTSNVNSICGYANRTNYYMYDGTYWVFLHNGVVDSNTTYYPTISASHYSTETIRDNATTSSYNNIWSATPTRSANYSTFTRTTSNVWSYCKSAPINIDDTVIIDFDYVHDNTNVTNKIFQFYGTDSSGAEKISSSTNGNTLGLTKDAHITIVTNNKGVGYYVDGRAVTWVSYARPVTQYFRFGINAANVTLSFKNYKQRKVNNVELSEIIDSKQDVISDLATIRDGANKGATALQPSSTLYESKLVWGNEAKNNSVTPVDMATYSEFNANRLAYLPSECITVEYSTDGGSTWSNYSTTDSEKMGLVTTSNNYYCGGVMTPINKDGRLRITFDAHPSSCKVYLAVRKLMIYLSTNGNSDAKCLVETAQYQSPDTFETVGTYTVSGYAGWNSIPLSFNFGQQPATQVTHKRKIRLTFYFNTVGTTANMRVAKIRLFGEHCWVSPSQLATDGHMYSIDTNKKSKFIGDVEATKLIKTGGTSSQFLKADGSTDSSTYMKETDLQAMVNNLATAINNI